MKRRATMEREIARQRELLFEDDEDNDFEEITKLLSPCKLTDLETRTREDLVKFIACLDEIAGNFRDEIMDDQYNQ